MNLHENFDEPLSLQKKKKKKEKKAGLIKHLAS